jgi:hypothetical protein
MDLSAALRQAECEEDRPQGFGRLPAVPTGGTLLKREGVPTVRRGLAWPSWTADGLAALAVTHAPSTSRCN